MWIYAIHGIRLQALYAPSSLPVTFLSPASLNGFCCNGSSQHHVGSCRPYRLWCQVLPCEHWGRSQLAWCCSVTGIRQRTAAWWAPLASAGGCSRMARRAEPVSSGAAVAAAAKAAAVKEKMWRDSRPLLGFLSQAQWFRSKSMWPLKLSNHVCSWSLQFHVLMVTIITAHAAWTQTQITKAS